MSRREVREATPVSSRARYYLVNKSHQTGF